MGNRPWTASRAASAAGWRSAGSPGSTSRRESPTRPPSSRGGIARRTLRLSYLGKNCACSRRGTKTRCSFTTSSWGLQVRRYGFEVGAMPPPPRALARTPAAPLRQAATLEPAGTGAAVMLSGVTGAPCPTGLGTHTSSATPVQTATAVATPPSARLARAERRRDPRSAVDFR